MPVSRSPLVVHRLGANADYQTVLALQTKLFDSVVAKSKAVAQIQFDAVKRGDKKPHVNVHDSDTPMHVILCEHGPRGVHTMGKRNTMKRDVRGTSSDSSSSFESQIVPTGRGGGLTYHGPGQLMMYLILHIPTLQRRVLNSGVALPAAAAQTGSMHFYTALLEQTLMDSLTKFGIHKSFAANTGIWVPDDDVVVVSDHAQQKAAAVIELPKFRTDAPTGASKIGFIGLELKQMCAMHGICLNVQRQCMSHFQPIVICEMEKATTTCMEDCMSGLGAVPEGKGLNVIEDVGPIVLDTFCRLTGLESS